MAKSKITKKGSLSFDREKEQEEELKFDPATEVDLEKFDNIEEYWKAMEELQKEAKRKKEEEKKKKAKEILASEEKEEKTLKQLLQSRSSTGRYRSHRVNHLCRLGLT